jgi:hypothetical protein
MSEQNKCSNPLKMSNQPGRNGTDVAKLCKGKTSYSQTQAEDRKRSPLIVKSTIRHDVSYSVLVKKSFSTFNFQFSIPNNVYAQTVEDLSPGPSPQGRGESGISVTFAGGNMTHGGSNAISVFNSDQKSVIKTIESTRQWKKTCYTCSL